MNDGHTALYRKYRPEAFAEVVGQEHITKVLEGAIQKENIPHALLFSGPRGTGKTSMARIFARALGTSEVDIYEMDAASNRGIDDVRELREAVHTLPYESKQKVYIIDEVHMLTKDAFNALLKTLEEPPAHVVFIFATTEEEKVLDTILSRCQVFRCQMPSRAILGEVISKTAKKEKFKIKPEAVDLIAVAADGSFRDALGILQKVILASGDKEADADEVAGIIGAPKNELLMEILIAFQKKDVEGGLKTIGKVVGENIDVHFFMRLLLERVRAVILMRYQKDVPESLKGQFSDEDIEVLKGYAEDKRSPIHSKLLLRLLEASAQMRGQALSHIALEVAVVDVCE